MILTSSTMPAIIYNVHLHQATNFLNAPGISKKLKSDLDEIWQAGRYYASLEVINFCCKFYS